MQLDTRICERAHRARDPRFDGRFFVGVLTTGIYCRPICPAPSPKPGNVRFFPSAAAAAGAGLRPCLRCRPEASPGTPAWVGTSATVARALRQIDRGALDDGGVDDLAARLDIGPRHLSRLFNRHLGASPLAVAQTRRLFFAKKLLTETDLKMADVAFASGFGSVRRFNEIMRKTYGRKPTELRRLRAASATRETFSLLLPYRAPLDWQGLIDFLGPRAIPGVEEVSSICYARNIRLGETVGRVEVRPAPGLDALALTVDFSDSKALLPISARIRRLFDLDADPHEIASQLSDDPHLCELLSLRPGLRVPGAWNGFELAVRAVLGQQVTVKGATTLAGRLAAAYGRKVDGGYLFPRPSRLRKARFGSVGLPKTRATALRRLAAACDSGDLRLEPGEDPERAISKLVSLPGIGDWTAQYIAMRALGEPDAFPASDLVLLAAANSSKGLGGSLTPTALRKLAERWRPWRAYAAMHLWRDHASRQSIRN